MYGRGFDTTAEVKGYRKIAAGFCLKPPNKNLFLQSSEYSILPAR